MLVPENEFPAVYIDKVVLLDGQAQLDVAVGTAGSIHKGDLFTLYKNASKTPTGNERVLKIDLEVSITIETILRTSLIEVEEADPNQIVRLMVSGPAADLDELAPGMWLVINNRPETSNPRYNV